LAEHKEHKDAHKDSGVMAHDVDKAKGVRIKVPGLHALRGSFWIMTTAVMTVAFIVAAYMYLTAGTSIVPGPGTLTANAAGQKAVDYINNNLVQSGSATLVSSIEVVGSDMYNVTTSYQGSDINVYISKSGKLLFIYGPIDTTEAIEKTSSTPTTAAAATKQAVPDLKFFVMSFCPYGNQAEEGLGPVIRLLGSKINWEPKYVIYSNYGSGYPSYCLDSESKYCSMHGIQELNQDVREICAFKYFKSKWWDFVDAVNANCNSQNADTCWEAQATKAGIDTAKIKACEKDEALTLLASEVASDAQYSATGSPMVFINGAQYNGGRDPASYQSSICSGFTTAPSECSTRINSTASASATAAGGCG
jgi:hypothetical protein